MYGNSGFSVNDIYFLIEGVGNTAFVAVISIFFGTLIGTIVGMIRSSKNQMLSILPLIYIEPFRNTPLLIQLFFVVYGIPMITGINFDNYTSAILVFSLNTGAFIAVLTHASILSVSSGQWEASFALGHGKISTFKEVIFKQAFRVFLPSSINLYVGQIQMSALIGLINIKDLTKVGDILTVRTWQPFLVWAIVMGVYFLISYPLTRYARTLEKRLEQYSVATT
jgi:His/Glu/Gln/Arg/opine family amino acid ABC transporter permease subunit